MAFTISKGTMLSTSIDAQIYLCRSFNHEKTNNTSTHLPSNKKHTYKFVLYNITCTIRRSILILVNCSLMLSQFLLNFSSSILTCNIQASGPLTFYLYPILQILILIDFSCNLKIIMIFSYSDFPNEYSKKKMSSLEIEDFKAINLPQCPLHCRSRRAIFITIISDVN